MIKMVAFDLFGVILSEGHMVSATLMPLLPKSIKKSTVKGFHNQYTRGKSAKPLSGRALVSQTILNCVNSF